MLLITIKAAYSNECTIFFFFLNQSNYQLVHLVNIGHSIEECRGKLIELATVETFGL